MLIEAFLWSNQAQEPITAQKLLQLTGHSPETAVVQFAAYAYQANPVL